METQEEFNQRKSAYLAEKLKLAKQLKDLVALQDEVLEKIAALQKPIKTRGNASGYWSGKRWKTITGSEIVPRKTDTIFQGWLYDGTKMIQEEQQYLIKKLFNPRYKNELQKNGRRSGNEHIHIRYMNMIMNPKTAGELQ
ncbi:MAG: hypothetical protein GY874_05915 [Desulfobacteraceae bacterium]|nr:hypothetical protein [Desulfobacteraceae bacterium]